MQSTTKAAVQATVQAAAGQVEVMVRNLADGMRDSIWHHAALDEQECRRRANDADEWLVCAC